MYPEMAILGFKFFLLGFSMQWQIVIGVKTNSLLKMLTWNV